MWFDCSQIICDCSQVEVECSQKSFECSQRVTQSSQKSNVIVEESNVLWEECVKSWAKSYNMWEDSVRHVHAWGICPLAPQKNFRWPCKFGSSRMTWENSKTLLWDTMYVFCHTPPKKKRINPETLRSFGKIGPFLTVYSQGVSEESQLVTCYSQMWFDCSQKITLSSQM